MTLFDQAGLCPHCAPAPNAVNHVVGHTFVGWGHGWQPCLYCKGSGVAPILAQSPFDVSSMVVECICGTCDFLDCTGRCCVNNAFFRKDGKDTEGPECWHCTHGDPKGGRQ